MEIPSFWGHLEWAPKPRPRAGHKQILKLGHDVWVNSTGHLDKVAEESPESAPKSRTRVVRNVAPKWALADRIWAKVGATGAEFLWGS